MHGTHTSTHVPCMPVPPGPTRIVKLTSIYHLSGCSSGRFKFAWTRVGIPSRVGLTDRRRYGLPDWASPRDHHRDHWAMYRLHRANTAINH
jgi:hypothetical protein